MRIHSLRVTVTPPKPPKSQTNANKLWEEWHGKNGEVISHHFRDRKSYFLVRVGCKMRTFSEDEVTIDPILVKEYEEQQAKDAQYLKDNPGCVP